MFLIFIFVDKHNRCACAFRTTASPRSKKRRHRGSKHGAIHKTNVRRAVTRHAFRVLGQGHATIGGQTYLRSPAGGAGAAIRAEGSQSARGISRGGAGNPRPRGERNPTCSPLVTSFASAISYGVRVGCWLVERLRARRGRMARQEGAGEE